MNPIVTVQRYINHSLIARLCPTPEQTLCSPSLQALVALITLWVYGPPFITSKYRLAGRFTPQQHHETAEEELKELGMHWYHFFPPMVVKLSLEVMGALTKLSRGSVLTFQQHLLPFCRPVLQFLRFIAVYCVKIKCIIYYIWDSCLCSVFLWDDNKNGVYNNQVNGVNVNTNSVTLNPISPSNLIYKSINVVNVCWGANTQQGRKLMNDFGVYVFAHFPQKLVYHFIYLCWTIYRRLWTIHWILLW